MAAASTSAAQPGVAHLGRYNIDRTVPSPGRLPEHSRGPERAYDWLHLLIEGTLVMGATQDNRLPRAARDLAGL